MNLIATLRSAVQISHAIMYTQSLLVALYSERVVLSRMKGDRWRTLSLVWILPNWRAKYARYASKLQETI